VAGVPSGLSLTPSQESINTALTTTRNVCRGHCANQYTSGTVGPSLLVPSCYRVLLLQPYRFIFTNIRNPSSESVLV
jgi:hypothetical protein